MPLFQSCVVPVRPSFRMGVKISIPKGTLKPESFRDIIGDGALSCHRGHRLARTGHGASPLRRGHNGFHSRLWLFYHFKLQKSRAVLERSCGRGEKTPPAAGIFDDLGGKWQFTNRAASVTMYHVETRAAAPRHAAPCAALGRVRHDRTQKIICLRGNERHESARNHGFQCP